MANQKKLFPFDPDFRKKENRQLNKAASAAVASATNTDIVPITETDSWQDFADSLTSPWGSAAMATQFTNAHVAVCVSVLADAVSQLPADIIRVEISNGSRTEIDDNAHPANFMFKGPNPDMTWSDFQQGIIASLLLDGNTYIAISRMPIGPQLFLLDPAKIRIIYSKHKSHIVAYEYGYGEEKQTFTRDEMIHMRDFNVSSPLKGTSRLESLHKELQMDEYIKSYNANFFKNGCTVGAMWSPERQLAPNQFKQIQKAMRAALSGTTKAFSLFVNKFPGKLEFPEQKHKDIAFLELLKYIRETINAVFRVPPYKAGILEYANYANSTQQQESFWTDGIIPLLRRIQDIINKDFIWKYYDEDHELKFNTKNISALQGDPKQRMEILTAYKREGILTTDECRADIDREPLNAEASQASEEEDKYVQVYDTFFQAQRKRIVDKVEDKSSGLNALLTYVSIDDIFDIESENEILRKALRNQVKDTIRRAGEIAYKSVETADVFDMDTDDVRLNLRTIDMKHDILNAKTYNILEQLLSTAIADGWGIKELTNRIKDKLSYKLAEQCAKELVPNIARRATSIANGQRLVADATTLANKENA